MKQPLKAQVGFVVFDAHAQTGESERRENLREWMRWNLRGTWRRSFDAYRESVLIGGHVDAGARCERSVRG